MLGKCELTFAVVFSCSLFGHAFVARCSDGVHSFSSTVLHSSLIISSIVGLYIHVACTVEACLPVACGTGSHASVWGARQRPVFGHLVCVGTCWDAPPSYPKALFFLTACLDRVRVHAPLVGGCAVGLMGGGVCSVRVYMCR